jgi:uncharacterized membrane protein
VHFHVVEAGEATQALSKFMRSKTFQFVMLMMAVTYLYWICGTQNYQTYDLGGGQEVTVGVPNSFGVVIVALPLVVIIYWYYKKWRVET